MKRLRRGTQLKSSNDLAKFYYFFNSEQKSGKTFFRLISPLLWWQCLNWRVFRSLSTRITKSKHLKKTKMQKKVKSKNLHVIWVFNNFVIRLFQRILFLFLCLSILSYLYFSFVSLSLFFLCLLSFGQDPLCDSSNQTNTKVFSLFQMLKISKRGCGAYKQK